MTKFRFPLTLNCILLISLIVTSCSGVPNIPNLIAPTPTPTVAPATEETSPTVPQAYPVALIETDPLLNTVIGHRSPITFYFNQGMNKASVESSINGLPDGTFTWTDEATVTFSPTQPYQPDAKLDIEIADSIQSASGFGIPEPIQISFTVADYLRGTNLLPKANTTDVNVDAAIAVSFNQPVVPLGADSALLPPAFTVLPSTEGNGEWVNTSTYIFYPEPAMSGGTEYTVSMNGNLQTVSGVGLDGSVVNAWKFLTATPRVVSISPSTGEYLSPEPEIKLTFNQPMDQGSVGANFELSGAEGAVNGSFAWNDDDTELTFTPENALARGTRYTLILGANTESESGMVLGEEYSVFLGTYDNFAVTNTDVSQSRVGFTFSSPLAEEELDEAITITPALENYNIGMFSYSDNQVYINGNFIPDTSYVVTLSETISDQWGQTLGEPFIFEFTTPPLSPSLIVAGGYTNLFVRPDEPVLFANAVNISEAEVTISPLSLQDYFLIGTSYDSLDAYTPAAPSILLQTFDLFPNQSQDVKLNLAEENNQLLPGLYYVSILAPEEEQKDFARNTFLVSSSNVNLTFKLGATEAFVWAVDLPSQTPVANAPVNIYDNSGKVIASGTTDGQGIWKGTLDENSSGLTAVLGSPDDAYFALASNSWNPGSVSWDFGIQQWVRGKHTEVYMYTDRPIYRPGQSVYYRGVVRDAFNGRYELPAIKSLPIFLSDGQNTLADINAQLSPFGTFNGQFELSQDAIPGYYTFSNNNLGLYFSFQVAEYRKPEINLNINFSSDEILQGDSAQANVDARYFFDAPAGGADFHWTLYSDLDPFYLPGYRTGLLNYLSTPEYQGGFLGEGTDQTSPDGTLSINLPAIPESESSQTLTLEATATDDSGLPVSARAEMVVHPADFYIGLKSDQWIGTVDSPLGFDVYTVNWEKEASGNKTLMAEFKQVRWDAQTDEYGYRTYTPVYTPVSSTNFTTNEDGKARLSFVPPSPGTYMLDVSGNGARSQTLVWVGGAGTAAWPDLTNQRIDLTADKESYQAGDTANIFIPNPFVTNSLALVTVERGLISNAEVLTLSGGGQTYALPLTDNDTPNIYVNVLILGQGNDFRHGLVNIPVVPDAQELKVQLFSNPSEAGPRDQVTFDVVVTDNKEQPVQGEFSLSVVDQAVLALADPNAEDILPAFYSDQPLGIETGLSLVTYGGLNFIGPPGLGGGGGGGAPPFIREDFPDTAYWNPSLITNDEGRGQVTMTLPDSLTTWQVDVRGLTTDTKVGQAETQIVSTKPLLIRPVTPRFLVSGDHVLMAAVVNNNTKNTLSVTVNMQSDGFVLDDPGSATRKLDIFPNSQERVEWWGTAGMADEADMVFSVTTSGTPSLQDSARPVWGQLPILRYTSPQAFVTGGVLRDASSQQEAISLPRTFVPGGGSGLDVELSPSLAGSLLSALDAMEVPSNSVSAEAYLSYLLPNIEVHRALSNAGIDDPELSDKVEKNLNESVSRLLYLQNQDGGWGWWSSFSQYGWVESGQTSDPYISAYILFGLMRAQLAGATIPQADIDRAAAYLQEAAPEINADTTAADLDEAAFIQFVLNQVPLRDQTAFGSLYDSRDRMSPTGKAFTAYAIQAANPADERVRELVSNIEADAMRTASSAHWETSSRYFSTLYTTAIVTYVLAQVDAANPLVIEAVRYLAAHRNANGYWNIGHENAWVMMALNEAMVGLGDLRADFTFNAALNDSRLTGGDINGIQIEPLRANVPLESLSPDSPNLLTIQRDDGLGRLYYNVVLNVNRPVQDVELLNAGMGIERVYCLAERSTAQSKKDARECTPLSSLSLDSGQQITAQLTLTLPHDSYYIIVEDHIPAGMEILDRNLKTSQQQVVNSTDIQVQFDDTSPFANGWGWWLFNQPQIHDEGVLFSADYLPAGTYMLTYTLIPLQAGKYQVLPAHAWQSFFPEVQGSSTGMVFEIKP